MASGFSIDVDVPKVVTIGVVSVLVLVVVLVGTHGYYLKYEREEFAAKNYDAANPLLDQVNKASAEHLGTYRWVNPERSGAGIPIDLAVRVAAQAKGRPPTTQPLGPGGGM